MWIGVKFIFEKIANLDLIEQLINKIIVSRLQAIGGIFDKTSSREGTLEGSPLFFVEMPYENFILFHKLDIYQELLKELKINNVKFAEMYVNNECQGSFFSHYPFDEQLDYLHLRNKYKIYNSIKDSIGYFHYIQKQHIHEEVIKELKKDNKYLVEEKGDWYLIFLKPEFVEKMYMD
jgi:hypothetical protein